MPDVAVSPGTSTRARPSGGARPATVTGLGGALPAAVVPNAPIAARLDVSEHWIVKRVGVRERRVASAEDTLTGLATRAGAQALDRAGVSPDRVDLVLVASSTQDDLLPNAAPLVATALGCTNAGAIDIGAACMGFLSALSLGAGYVESGRADCVLAIGADLFTRFIDHDDPRTAALFGDGAGAAVLTAGEGGARVTTSLMRCDASEWGLVHMRRDRGILEMSGQETFKLAVAELSSITREALAEAGLDVLDVDLFVYHQANARILKAVAEALALPQDRLVICVDRMGNTSAASIPLALDEAAAEGRLRPGTRTLMAAIGAGFTWGATLLEWEVEG